MVNDQHVDILDHAPALIWRAQPDGEFCWFNQSWLAFTGRTRTAETEHSRPGTADCDIWLNEIHPADQAKCLAAYRNAVQTRTMVELLYRLRRHDGEYRWIIDQGRPYYSTDGTFAGYFGFGIDVNQRIRTEKIQEGRLYLMQYAESHALDEVVREMLDKITELVDSQIGFCHFLGADQNTIIQTTWSSSVLDRQCAMNVTQGHLNVKQAGVWADCIRQRKAIIHNDYVAIENRIGLPEGHSPITREMIVPVFRNDLIVAVLGIGNKITNYNQDDLEVVSQFADLTWSIVEQKTAAQALSRSEERFRILFETMAQGVVYQDAAGRITAANPAATSILGLTLDQMQGRTSIDPRWKAIHEDGSDFPGDTHPAMVALQTGARVNDVVMGIFHPHDNTHHWILVNAYPQFHPNETTPYQVYATFTDFTVRNKMEVDLRRRTEELEILFSLSQDMRTAQTAPAIMRIGLDHAKRLVAADCGAVIMYYGEEGQFNMEVGDGPLSSDIGVRIDKDEGLAGFVRRNNRAVQSINYDHEPHQVKRSAAARYLGPVACAPLRSETAFLGVIVVGKLRGGNPQPFSERELSLLSAACEITGSTLRRVQLYDQAITQLQRIQALRSIDVAIKSTLDVRISLNILLETITNQLKVDAAAIMLLNIDTLRLEHSSGRGFFSSRIPRMVVHLHSDPVGQAAMQHNILTIPDLRQASDFRRAEVATDEGFVSYCSLPLIAKGELLGVIEVFSRKPLAFSADWLEFLETLADQAAISIDHARLFDSLEKTNLETRLAYEATIEGWSKAIDLRDTGTEGHSQRVTNLTVQLARRLGMSNDHITDIRHGALLHDVGKLGVPDAILTKPGDLTTDERDTMNKHAQYAYDMLSPIVFLRPALNIPYCHHENWDGSGYPRGLKGEQIPLEARIFSIVDVYDALASDRYYRHAWPRDKIVAYLQMNSGSKFDPRLVKVFLDLLAAGQYDDNSADVAII